HDPIHARRFHGHRRDATFQYPVHQLRQLAREGLEYPHVLPIGIPARWYRHVVLVGPNVDSTRVRIDPLQPVSLRRVLPCLLPHSLRHYSCPSLDLSDAGEQRHTCTLPNGIALSLLTGVTNACVAPPSTMLAIGPEG